ncbi:hypothetical protein SAMN05216267_1006251 [Actinacidiphila rubida]|uniref:Uncharacterized protein n=2 Tax=Actinacidiphila rubida TaxID=310780 RepID=A0A1H8HHZ7_9ACTN|nr:hypothetical protein [Actinacidiphila rubida]SEN55842.1 hypothetical protein SAMN05216267_1006251 [Actinacidiphila rubida]
MPSVIIATADDLALPLEEQVVRTSAALDTHGHIVALAPAEPADPARRRLHTVRSALEADRIAIVPLALPPLARTLLGEQLRQLSGTDLGPGVLAGAARLLTHYLHAGALLGSVAKLDRVPVGVGDHVRSLVPGRHFAVLAHPEPYLATADPGSVPPGPGYQTQLAVAGRGVDPGWVTGPLAAAWRTQHLREIPLPGDSARWWGTAKLVEFTAYIADIGMLYQLVTSVRRDTCPWCGLEVIGDQCLFCDTRLGTRSAPGRHAAAAGPARPAVPAPATAPAKGRTAAVEPPRRPQLEPHKR